MGKQIVLIINGYPRKAKTKGRDILGVGARRTKNEGA